MHLPLILRPRPLAAHVGHWTRMFAGISPLHQPQGLGRCFEVERVRGYPNDLTGKCNWQCPMDEFGVSMNRLSNGTLVYAPIGIALKALGHYDRYLLERNRKDFEIFLCHADWLVRTQDSAGGWDCWSDFRLAVSSPHSAMMQGLGISILVRAGLDTENPLYIEYADRAQAPFRRPLEDGGVSVLNGEDVVFEEVPMRPPNTVLNGWIFGLWGLRDMAMAVGDKEADDLYEHSLDTLIRWLPRFDVGYWSAYDMVGNLTSPFYHDIHIAQLEALCLMSTSHVLAETRRRWEGYRRKRLNRARAIAVKGRQKLLAPATILPVP